MGPLPTPKELIKRFASSYKQNDFIENSRKTIQGILDGTDSRFLLIVGPCSIHDLKGAHEYATNLKKIKEICSDTLYIVMRTYFEKARTSFGWKGLIHDPLLDGSCQIAQGLSMARQLLLHLADLEIPAACEFLDPVLSPYFSDLISWGCVGARTASSQIHRQMASGSPMPIGFKNTTEGNVTHAINGILLAARPHTYVGVNLEGSLSIHQTQGNPTAHLVLRGGESGPNYEADAIGECLSLLKQAKLPKRLIVDCAHDNSQKKFELQPNVFHSIFRQYLEGNKTIRGAMLESYLLDGHQEINSNLKYGLSLTDSCLGFEKTETLIHWAHQKLKEDSPTPALKCASLL